MPFRESHRQLGSNESVKAASERFPIASSLQKIRTSWRKLEFGDTQMPFVALPAMFLVQMSGVRPVCNQQAPPTPPWGCETVKL